MLEYSLALSKGLITHLIQVSDKIGIDYCCYQKQGIVEVFLKRFGYYGFDWASSEIAPKITQPRG